MFGTEPNTLVAQVGLVVSEVLYKVFILSGI